MTGADRRGESELEPEEPGAKAPAPGALRLVQQFINSLDIEGGTDELSSPSDLSVWLHAHGLTPRRARLGPDDLRRAVEFRELLRAIVSAHNGDALDEATIRALNRRLREIEIVARCDASGTIRMEGARRGLAGALAQIVAIIYAEMQTGRWDRLKACSRDVCRWAFYDHSRNRTGRWCTMAICGARTKASQYYRRRHPGRSAVRSS